MVCLNKDDQISIENQTREWFHKTATVKKNEAERKLYQRVISGVGYACKNVHFARHSTMTVFNYEIIN